MRAIKSLDSMLFCLHMCSWRLIVNKKIIAKQDTQLQSVLQQKKHRISYYIKSNWQIWHHPFYARVRNSCQKKPNFLSQWEQLKVLAPYCLQENFRNSCHNKRPNFLSQLEQSKVLTPYFFVFTCAHEDSLWIKK